MIFSSQRSFQKTNERIQLHYYETSGRRVFVHFLEEIEDTKKTFRNYLTFSTLGLTLRLFIAYVISNASQLVGFANLKGAFATHSYL